MFYENLSDRTNELEEVREQEDIPVNVLAKEHMDAIRETTEERLVGQILGHHFDLAKTGILPLEVWTGRINGQCQEESGQGRRVADFLECFTEVKAKTWIPCLSAVLIMMAPSPQCLQEESQSVVLKANQINFAVEQESDEEEELNEEDERLYLVITSIDTRKIAVGSGSSFLMGTTLDPSPK